MDPRLLAAARTGNVDYLLRLITEEVLLLDTVALTGAETPLHVASMCGHLPFVQEMLKLRNQFAYELDQGGFSPLHLASACGHLEIVLELLKVDHNLCAIKGKDQRLPVHCAVVKGRVDVMKELLSASPDSVEMKTARGETVLDLAVQNNQFAAFKLLVEHVKKFNKEQVLSEKDYQGNTILHLAATRKQFEVFKFLLVDDDVTKEVVEVNSLNERGMTPLDVLLEFQNEASDLGIQAALLEAGAKRGKDMSSSHPPQTQSMHNQVIPTSTTQAESMNNNQLAPQSNTSISVSEVKAGLFMTVAALIATATFQAVLSPPGGLWQDDNSNATPKQIAGKSIMATKHPVRFVMFIVCNTFGFYSSLCAILYLIESQYALRFSIYAILFSYAFCFHQIAVDVTIRRWIFVLFAIVNLVLLCLHKWLWQLGNRRRAPGNPTP